MTWHKYTDNNNISPMQIQNMFMKILITRKMLMMMKTLIVRIAFRLQVI